MDKIVEKYVLLNVNREDKQKDRYKSVLSVLKWLLMETCR